MRYWLLPLVWVLAGCQTTPSSLPVAEPRPAAACHWPSGEQDSQEVLSRAVTALEGEGFLIRHTNSKPAVVSAERSRTRPGYGSHYGFLAHHGHFGHFGHGHLHGHHLHGHHLHGHHHPFGFGGLGLDATQVERVSLLVGDETIRVSRDLQVIDWRGDLARARTASTDEFCRRLHDAMAAGGDA